MMPAALVPNRLYLFVIGPGFGESIVIRVPPRHWIVIDSCKPGERAAALEILGRFDGECTCAVLTHRHQDHYPGFSQVLAHADWRIVGCADHGFFHWQPDDHEIVDDLPTGDVLWKHRRAMVGHNLSHPSAVHMKILQSDLEVVVPRGTSAFRTYGALGFFHGGATLQEMIIPVIVATWPTKARKVNVVLKPVGHIASEAPRVQVQAAATAQLFNADVNLLARRVLVKVKDTLAGKLVFRHGEPITVEPEGAPVTVQLQMVEPKPQLAYGAPLLVEVLDADNEEVLVREDITLKIDISDW